LVSSVLESLLRVKSVEADILDLRPLYSHFRTKICAWLLFTNDRTLVGRFEMSASGHKQTKKLPAREAPVSEIGFKDPAVPALARELGFGRDMSCLSTNIKATAPGLSDVGGIKSPRRVGRILGPSDANHRASVCPS
jgi:hypothetical protein